MPRYAWNHNYRSNLAVGVAGETADLPDELADAINRDSPGALAPVADTPKAEPKPESRAIDEPPHDRMVRKASKRGAP